MRKFRLIKPAIFDGCLDESGSIIDENRFNPKFIESLIKNGFIEEVPEVPELREWTDEDVLSVINEELRVISIIMKLPKILVFRMEDLLVRKENKGIK